MAGAPIAGAVFTSLNFLVASINQLGTIVRENYRLDDKFKSCLSQLKQAVYYAEGDLVKFEEVNEIVSMELLEQLFVIEDYIAEQTLPDELLARLKSGLLAKKLAVDPRPYEIKRVESHISSLKATHDRLKESATSRNDSTDLLPPTAPSSPLEKHLGKGFQERFNRLQELLSPLDGSMRRISIVGSVGLGKSSLAMAIYETATVQSELNPQVLSKSLEAATYHCKIWIDASVSNTVDDILNGIKEAHLVAGGKNSYETVTSYLLGRRYMVIIDNLWSSEIKWKDLSKAFPENNTDSRIVITTSIHSVAREWSSGMYYIYHMQCLGDADAKELYWKRVCDGSLRSPTHNESDRAKSILDKCDGLPAALTSAGNYASSMSKNAFLTLDLAKETCVELNNLVVSRVPEFSDMRRTFVKCYQSLENHDERVCLLYFSMYQKGSRISRQSFARKLEAENLVTKESAISCLDELINKSLIFNNDNKCQIQGTMLQFAIHKASAKNLVTVVEEGQIRLNKQDEKFFGQIKPSCRRLVVHCTKETSTCPIPDGCELSNIRSLTIFRSPDAVAKIDRVDFKLFKVMRVLDLEGCHGFKTINGLKSICELPLLKFLNIKNTDVVKIPKEIENLRQLETIDFRRTKVHKIPVQLIKLPAITSIFGVFVLPEMTQKEAPVVTAFLKQKSKLHTLDGLRINKVSDFEAVIRNAKCLKKIKVIGDMFLRSSAPALRTRQVHSLLQVASEEEKKNIDEFNEAAGSLVNMINGRSKDLCSISFQSSAMSNSFISYPVTDEGDSVLTYLKLHGTISCLPDYAFAKRKELTKICLYSTTLTSKQIVEGLENLKFLEHLKLGHEHDNAWDGVFLVRKGSFPALRKLRFKGTQPYPQIKIEEGGMSVLASIELYCFYLGVEVIGGGTSKADDVASHDVKITTPEALLQREDPNWDIRVEGLEHLTFLDEVMLHHSANDAIVKAWEAAARAHGNLPCVIRQGGWDYKELL